MEDKLSCKYILKINLLNKSEWGSEKNAQITMGTYAVFIISFFAPYNNVVKSVGSITQAEKDFRFVFFFRIQFLKDLILYIHNLHESIISAIKKISITLYASNIFLLSLFHKRKFKF